MIQERQQRPQAVLPPEGGRLNGVISSVAHEAHRDRPNLDSTASPGLELYRLLPPTGFWWPVHVEPAGWFSSKQYRPPLDTKEAQCSLRSIELAPKLGSDDNHRAALLGDWEGKWQSVNWPRGITTDVLEMAMAMLVVAATEAVEESVEAGIYEDPKQFVRELKGRNEKAWWAGRNVSWKVLVKMLRLVMVARQGWLASADKGKGGGWEESGLANAVDGLLNVVECRFAEDVKVMDKHFGNEESWELWMGRSWKGGG